MLQESRKIFQYFFHNDDEKTVPEKRTIDIHQTYHSLSCFASTFTTVRWDGDISISCQLVTSLLNEKQGPCGSPTRGELARHLCSLGRKIRLAASLSSTWYLGNMRCEMKTLERISSVASAVHLHIKVSNQKGANDLWTHPPFECMRWEEYSNGKPPYESQTLTSKVAFNKNKPNIM